MRPADLRPAAGQPSAQLSWLEAPRVGLARALTILVLGLGVALMHSFVGGSEMATPMDHGSSTMGQGTAAPGEVQMSAAPTASQQTHMSDGDHCELGHPCVFVMGGGIPLPPVILVLLMWGFAAAPVLRGQWTAIIGRLGRPPPWAMPTHLTLSVIRC